MKNSAESADFKDALIGEHLSCHSGFANNQKIRRDSSSGGIITTLLIFALENKIIDGAIVARIKKDNVFLPEFFVARTKEEIISASGSKYGLADLAPILKKIASSSEFNKLAFVGLPCQISVLKNLSKSNPSLNKKIVLSLGLFCGHRPSKEGIDFFLKKNNIEKKQVKHISYRGDGWPGSVKITLLNGQIKSLPFPLFWSTACNLFFFQKACIACTDCLSENADISFGDAWLKEFKGDNIGRSILVCRTERGSEVLKAAKSADVINIDDISSGKIIQSQIINIYLKKKCFRSNRPDLIDRLIFRAFKLFSSAGTNKFFRKTLHIVPLKVTLLFNKVFGKIYCQKAIIDLKKHTQ